MRKRSAALVGAGFVALAVLGIGVWSIRRERADPDALPPAMAGRTVALSDQLAQVAAPYRVVLGDSHAERLFLPSLCGAPVVDAGFSGARIAEIAQAAARLRFPVSAEAIVIVAGTNDLRRRRQPEGAEAQAAFRRAFHGLLETLRPHAQKLFAAPIPALDGARTDVAKAFDVAARPAYDTIIREECLRAGCMLADLFPADALNGGEPSDGVHPPASVLTRPGGVRDRLEEAVCPR